VFVAHRTQRMHVGETTVNGRTSAWFCNYPHEALASQICFVANKKADEQQRWCARSETPFKSFMSLPIASALARTLMFCNIFDLACSITRQAVAEMQSWNDRVYIIKAVSFRLSRAFSGSVLDKIDTHNDFKTL
jgi:hypothetical protein